MIDVSSLFLSTLGRPAVYRATPDGEGIPTTAIFKEGAGEVRFGRSQLIAFQAEASIPASIAPVRFARLELGGSVYSIEQILRGKTPGLMDVGLKRLSGAHVTEDRYGAAALAVQILGRLVTIGGREVWAQGFARDIAEENELGQVIETTKLVLSVASADVAGVRPGAPAVVDGESLRVWSISPGARGLSQVVLE